MFDLNQTDMTDLASDFNEFNDFFKNKTCQLKEIERPQNPFHKNFQSYQNQKSRQNKLYSSDPNPANQRNSLSLLNLEECSNDLMKEARPQCIRKYQSLEDYNSGSNCINKENESELKLTDLNFNQLVNPNYID